MKDYYRILGVSPSADRNEIKRAYRRLAKHHHPDTDSNSRNAAYFAEIGEAYAVLSSPEGRWRYDRTRRSEAAGDTGTFMHTGRIPRRWIAGLIALSRLLRGAVRGEAECAECGGIGSVRFGRGAFAVHRPCPVCSDASGPEEEDPSVSR